MTHINAEIEKHFRTINVVGNKEIEYTIEKYSKDGKYKATFEGKLNIRKISK